MRLEESKRCTSSPLGTEAPGARVNLSGESGGWTAEEREGLLGP